MSLSKGMTWRCPSPALRYHYSQGKPWQQNGRRELGRRADIKDDSGLNEGVTAS